MYNKVILVGRITYEPEMKTTTNGTEVVDFQLAVNRYGKDQQADFFKVVCFGKTAEFMSNYVTKGKLLLVDGSLRNSIWQDKSGQERSRVEIIASRIRSLSKKDEKGTNPPVTADSEFNLKAKPTEDDTIPF